MVEEAASPTVPGTLGTQTLFLPSSITPFKLLNTPTRGFLGDPLVPGDGPKQQPWPLGYLGASLARVGCSSGGGLHSLRTPAWLGSLPHRPPKLCLLLKESPAYPAMVTSQFQQPNCAEAKPHVSLDHRGSAANAHWQLSVGSKGERPK